MRNKTIVIIQALFWGLVCTSLHSQKSVPVNTVIVNYNASACNLTEQHIRHYINDTVYVDMFENVIGTFMVNDGKILMIKRNIPYIIADLDNDTSKNTWHYSYSNKDGYDTVKLPNENELYYKLRVEQQINIFKPYKTDTLNNGKVVYEYYVLGNCYPVSEKCIAAKIINGQCGIMYFERRIGVAGNSASNQRCKYLITPESYNRLLAYLHQ